jgi:hypothetical protein
MNVLNQKAIRPQNKPVRLSQLSDDQPHLFFARYPELKRVIQCTEIYCWRLKITADKSVRATDCWRYSRVNVTVVERWRVMPLEPVAVPVTWIVYFCCG